VWEEIRRKTKPRLRCARCGVCGVWHGCGMGRGWDSVQGGAGVCEGEQEGGAGEPVHVRGEEADAAERCVPRLVALVICCEWGEWGECGGAADVDGGGGDAG
ncbi:hypothetical protein B0H14DRAFT_2640128, partial [Mycena olivaceomarginata]